MVDKYRQKIRQPGVVKLVASGAAEGPSGQPGHDIFSHQVDPQPSPVENYELCLPRDNTSSPLDSDARRPFILGTIEDSS